MLRTTRLGLRGLLGLTILLVGMGAPAAAAPEDDANPFFRGLKWREVGPYRGGRSAAVAGIPSQPLVYYFGATGGGVWKTQDGGQSWANVSDGYFGGSIGAVAVSEWDPNVIYVGGGEKTVRGNVSHGDGVWKSTDAGKTWRHIGLDDTRHIPRIRIHPKDPDRVYVAALGHLFGPNKQRGVFRSTDGGKQWKKILFVNEDAGAVDLAMDPTNPRILYASFWRVRREPWTLESGGEGSSLWKSTDGGDTWTELTAKPGMPKSPVGIIGISVSQSNPQNLYAIIEAEQGGVFRSKDGGDTWTRTNQQRDLRQRAWYYTRIYADPSDEEAVYVPNVRFHFSKDGGKTFTEIPTPHGDNHDLWIAPDDPKRMIEANDGGANVSFDGGKTWSTQSNQPTAQFYRVSLDNAFPYRLLGGQQDNSAVRIRSRSAFGRVIGVRDWEPTAGGESGHIVAKPDDPDVVYGGSYDGFLTMVNHRTGELRNVTVWPDNPMGWGAEELKYRFNWNFPLFFSPHDSDVLYAAANVLFKTRDGGATWQQISPDLTRNDKTKMGPSGGPITKDNTSVEYYGTIFAALESPHERGVLWAGTDDGLIQLSRDNGQNWTDVTPKSMPEWMQINGIEIHPTEPGGLYVAGTRYKLDDFRPYLYKTTDYGQSWQKITDGIDPLHFTRAIRADPDRLGLLYAGTERGVYVSLNDGKSWDPLQLNLPIVPITDLAVRDRDVVAATQGRGFWILDDVSPLHQLDDSARDATQYLFRPRPTLRLRGGGRRRDNAPVGQNSPTGTILYYYLAEEPAAETTVQLDISDSDGNLIRSFTRKPPPGEETKKEDRDPTAEDLRKVEVNAGLNRFVWDLRYPPAEKFKGLVLWNRRLQGPRAKPGMYWATLTVGESSQEVPFEVVADPRSSATPEDFAAQFDFLIAVRDKLTETHRAIGAIRDLKEQIKALEGRLEEGHAASDVRAATEELTATLDEVETTLYQTKMRSRQDPLNFPIRLNDKLAGLLSGADFGDFAPTEQMEEVRQELTRAIDEQLSKYRRIVDRDLRSLNDRIREHRLPTLVAKPQAAETRRAGRSTP